MTEKRFTVDDGLEDVLCWEINDKENENMTCGECVKLLNELHEENEELEKENEQLKQQMQRLYNYFADWFDDIVPPCDFSEMWDCVKEDEKWD